MRALTLLDYQPDWPDRFRDAAAELRVAFAGMPVEVEHVGSTAVVGLCAKPVLDILLGARSLESIVSRAGALATLGYAYRREYEGELPDRRYFVRPDRRGPRVHLHGVVLGDAIWRRHLAFRDALRADAELAGRYADLKRALALAHARDRAAYTVAKGPFIARVLGDLGHP